MTLAPKSTPLEVTIEVIYTELRALAAAQLRRERSNHTLQPTALVHEAFLRLAAAGQTTWPTKTQFLAAAAPDR